MLADGDDSSTYCQMGCVRRDFFRCRLKRIHTNSAKAQECRNGNFRLSTNSGCFSLSRRPLPVFSVVSTVATFRSRHPLPASFLCRVVFCLLLFSVVSSSAYFSSLSRRPLPASRRVVLLLVASSSACSLSRRPLPDFTCFAFMDSTSRHF